MTQLFSGTIHRHEGLVHEERSGLRPGVQHHRPVHLQRPAGPARADPPCEGHGGRAHGAGGQQVRPGGREGGRQGPGPQHGQAVQQLRLHGDLSQGQNWGQRREYSPSPIFDVVLDGCGTTLLLAFAISFSSWNILKADLWTKI